MKKSNTVFDGSNKTEQVKKYKNKTGRAYVFAPLADEVLTSMFKRRGNANVMADWVGTLQMLKLLQDKIHTNALHKGFWIKSTETGTKLMLIVSELAEAMEAHRTGKMLDDKEFCKLEDITTPKNRILFEKKFKETFEMEIADVFIRLFDLCGGMGIDIASYIYVKMLYNEGREKLHGKKY